MYTVQDQTGNFVSLPFPARRIVSLVPSQTELLARLGLDEQVVGITRFCIHPNRWYRSKPRVGGTKQLHPERIRALQPDLVLANKEENVREQVEEIRRWCPVYVSDVKDLEDALQMIRDVGALTGKDGEAFSLATGIAGAFQRMQTGTPLTALYLIWRQPYMAAGGDTFIHALLQRAGFVNVLAHQARYPVLTPGALVALQPQVVLLSSEPYPFTAEHGRELQALLPGSRILLADGSYFSWYGSRLLGAPAYFEKLRESLILSDHGNI
ncbi:MAG TPA: helical backbone metal receptor [Lacibacter sp.]|nr:helical backbone metal receptor [Lacibacter sp.]HMO89768.1 helical backbone metal receptor [Lacibacter sp.]HMP87296.1 helical backbone metal receptor [Lacibacter sp.]